MSNKLNIQATYNNVVVEPITLTNTTAGGFDLSGITDVNEKQGAGIVFSFGEFCGKKADGSYTLEVGMKILFNKFNATPITIEGKTYSIIPYQNIFMTL